MIQNQSAGSGDVVSVLTGYCNSKSVLSVSGLTGQHHVLAIAIGESKSTSSSSFIASWVNSDPTGTHGKAMYANNNALNKYEIDIAVDLSAGTLKPSSYSFQRMSYYDILVYGPPIN